MSVIQSSEAVAGAGREPHREDMLIVESTRVRKRVVGRQGSVGPALKAFPPGKNKVVVRAHLIGQINRTHVRLVNSPGYVHDRIGIVKSRYPINGHVRLERVV